MYRTQSFLVKNVLIILVLAVPYKAVGQNQSTLSITRINEKINFDGKVDDPIWDNVPNLTMTSHLPEYGQPPNKNSVIKVAYDDDYLYLAAICYEDNNNIQASSFKRDANWNLKSDHVALILDTYNDAENGVMFVVSPSGSRTDQTIRNDGIEGSFYNDSWNTFWDAEVNQFEGGWQAEIRIPFEILRFDTKDLLTTMGMTVYRYSAHDKMMDIFPVVSNEFGFFSFSKPSLTQEITFQNIQNKRPFYFTPYVLGSRSELTFLNTDETAYTSEVDKDFTGGFSAQYAISNNLNADLSFNTDFAQVEADNQQVNLTRFSLFFPEKRKFFQERSSTFEFNNDENNKLFHSRQIGLRSGTIIPLWGGARVVGRAGNVDFGVLSMQSKSTTDFDSENYGVIRFRKDLLNDNSYLGGMLTTVASKGGAYNLGYGIDALFNVVGDEYIKVNVAQTASDIDSSGNAYDKSRIFLQWEKRKNVGFGYRLNFGHVGKDYNPALGFENRYNYWRLGDKIFYNIWMKEKSSLKKIDLSLNSNAFVNHSTSEIESATINPAFNMTGKNEFSLDIGVTSFFDHPIDTFSISDEVYFVPNKYWNHSLNVSYSTPQINLYSFSLGYQYGSFYNGTIHSPSIEFDYLISKYMQFNIYSEYNHIQLPSFSAFESMVTRFSLSLALNVKWTITSFTQYNSTLDLWTVNNKLRYNPRDGVDLYLVYNGNYNADTKRVDPTLPATQSSLFVVKYSHTLSF